MLHPRVCSDLRCGILHVGFKGCAAIAAAWAGGADTSGILQPIRCTLCHGWLVLLTTSCWCSGRCRTPVVLVSFAIAFGTGTFGCALFGLWLDFGCRFCSVVWILL